MFFMDMKSVLRPSKTSDKQTWSIIKRASVEGTERSKLFS